MFLHPCNIEDTFALTEQKMLEFQTPHLYLFLLNQSWMRNHKWNSKSLRKEVFLIKMNKFFQKDIWKETSQGGIQVMKAHECFKKNLVLYTVSYGI